MGHSNHAKAMRSVAVAALRRKNVTVYTMLYPHIDMQVLCLHISKLPSYFMNSRDIKLDFPQSASRSSPSNSGNKIVMSSEEAD